jgi:hypothetical protein
VRRGHGVRRRAAGSLARVLPHNGEGGRDRPPS